MGIHRTHTTLTLLVGIPVIGILVFRTWLLVRHDVPVGLDGGMYRDYFLEHQNIFQSMAFDQLPDYILQGFPPFLGIMWSTLSLVGITADHLIIWWPPMLMIGIASLVYAILRHWSSRQAVVGWMLTLFSTVLFLLAWSGFLKQLLATFFLLASLYWVLKQRYILVLLFQICTLFTHRPTGLFLAVLFGIFSLLYIRSSIGKKTALTTLIVLVITSLMYLPVMSPLILDHLTWHSSISWLSWANSGGTFFDRTEFLMYVIPSILLLLAGTSIYVKRRIWPTLKRNEWEYQRWLQNPDHALIFIAWCLGLIWVTGGIIFYHRMQPLLEIMTVLLLCIVFVPIFLHHLWGKILISLVIVAQVITSTIFAYTHSEPKIPKQEMDIIRQLGTLLPERSYVVSSHPNYTAWLIGYSGKARDIIWPGITDHWPEWSVQDWAQWRMLDGYSKCERMYEKYHDGYEPMFLFVGSLTREPFNLDGGYCFGEVYELWDVRLYEILFHR